MSYAVNHRNFHTAQSSVMLPIGAHTSEKGARYCLAGDCAKVTGAGAPSHCRLNPQGNTSRSLSSTSLALLSGGKATPFARGRQVHNFTHRTIFGGFGRPARLARGHAAAAQRRREPFGL
eukprot:scaffold38485_cov27-Phaeocystis_antarctica.AAC.1